MARFDLVGGVGSAMVTRKWAVWCLMCSSVKVGFTLNEEALHPSRPKYTMSTNSRLHVSH